MALWGRERDRDRGKGKSGNKESREGLRLTESQRESLIFIAFFHLLHTDTETIRARAYVCACACVCVCLWNGLVTARDTEQQAVR